MPSAAALSRADGRIIGWWQQAYLEKIDTSLPNQFVQEARASLPTFSTSELSDVFAAVTLQRIRLRHDQQAAEWDGSSWARASTLIECARTQSYQLVCFDDRTEQFPKLMRKPKANQLAEEIGYDPRSSQSLSSNNGHIMTVACREYPVADIATCFKR